MRRSCELSVAARCFARQVGIEPIGGPNWPVGPPSDEGEASLAVASADCTLS